MQYFSIFVINDKNIKKLAYFVRSSTWNNLKAGLSNLVFGLDFPQVWEHNICKFWQKSKKIGELCVRVFSMWRQADFRKIRILKTNGHCSAI